MLKGLGAPIAYMWRGFLVHRRNVHFQGPGALQNLAAELTHLQSVLTVLHHVVFVCRFIGERFAAELAQDDVVPHMKLKFLSF